ncbi:Rz1-like lysis system protein LysC [Vibrio quintilis]|uniref:Rz1-like lysis system protein LysC n=1 Tax=Vibrio quintilis TaxID=1117707 RepID=UPI003F9564EF
MKSNKFRQKCAIALVLFLPLLLSSCASNINPVPVVQTQYVLPPEGIITPCYKPQVIGTWPEVVTEDIPRLKAALRDCAKHADDYLKWRTMKDKPG